MDGLVLLGRLLLAGVFAVAGVAKLLDAEGSRRGLAEFGVPTGLVRPLALLLPLAELAVAAALLPVATAWWGAVAALGLLAAFLVGIGASLARGRRPPCRCFGQLSTEPIGAGTVVRNGALALVALALVLAGPGNVGPSAVAWLGDLSAAERGGLLLGAAIVALLGGVAWLLLQVLRQQGRLLLRLDEIEARLDGRVIAGAGSVPHDHVAAAHGANGHAHGPPAGLPIGAPAPDLDLPDLDGERWTLERLTAPGTPLVLLFVDPQCGPCASLLPDVAAWRREHPEAAALALVSRGTPAENREKVAGLGLGPVLLQQDFEVAEAFQAAGTPAAVVVRADGSIDSATVAGPDAIRDLLARVAAPRAADGAAERANGHAHRPEPGPPLGAPAPPFELPDLDGRTVSLAERRGRKTLLLFWNPGCGFCRRMLPDLLAWEADSPSRAPELLVISTGPADENRRLGFRSTVLLDEAGAAARAYEASGTPMAVLVDAEGRIASTLVAGAPGVLALAGARAARASA